MLYRTSTLALLLAFAGPVRAQSPLSIGVLLNFEKQPPAAFIAALKRELTGIMSDASFAVHWIPADRTGETWDRAFIVKISGNCSGVAGRAFEPGARLTLAQSVADNGSILPYAQLDCDRLKSFLRAPGEARFGRATGRLLAHELYHILLQTREHSKTGIAKAVQSPAALLSRSLRFQSEDLERFRSVH